MTDKKWQPTCRPIIVCAANKMPDGLLILGARHWDAQMVTTIRAIYKDVNQTLGLAEQGFVDQFNRFYTREEADQIAKQNDQIRWPEDRLSEVALHSEDLY